MLSLLGLLAACSTDGAVRESTSQSIDEPIEPAEVVVEPVVPDPMTTLDPEALRQDGESQLITYLDEVATAPPVDPELDPTDPSGFRRLRRPALPERVEQRWMVEVDRFDIRDVFGAGDVLVVWGVSTDRKHFLQARSAQSGEPTWRLAPDVDEFLDVMQSGDLLVVRTLASGAVDHVVIDLLGGTELEVSGPGGPLQEGVPGWVARGVGDGPRPLTEFINPRTGDSLVLDIVGTGDGSLVARDGNSFVEYSLLDLEPLGRREVPATLDGLAELDFFERSITWPARDGIEVFNADGSTRGVLTVDTPLLLATGEYGEREMVWVFGLELSSGHDLSTAGELWQRAGQVQSLGIYDGQAYGIFEAGQATEIFSLDTGDEHCTIRAPRVQPTRNGFVVGSTYYDFRCAPVWTIDAGDRARYHLVDGGVVTWFRDGDTVELRFIAGLSDSTTDG